MPIGWPCQDALAFVQYSFVFVGSCVFNTAPVDVFLFHQATSPHRGMLRR